jgi:uncharacterized membrane protein
MPYQWAHEEEPDRYQWVLKRNCALTPAQLGLCLAALGGVSLGIAAACAMVGAWPVLPFSCIEVVALGVAFVVYGRHAADYERIVVGQGEVLVESASAHRVRRQALRPTALRVEYRGSRRELIRLVAGAQALEVGRFVPDDRRGALAAELRTSLARLRDG